MIELAPGLHSRAGVEVDSLAYDRYTGRWSRLFVPDTIAAASVRQGERVLDMSTGTGEAAIGLLLSPAARICIKATGLKFR